MNIEEYTKKVMVRKLTNAEGAAWDELVLSSQQKSLFLLDDFQKMWVETDSSLNLLKLGCFDENGHLIGGQAYMYKSAIGIRIQTYLSIFYINTPIVSGNLPDNGREKYSVLSALSNASKKYFPFQRIECDPSLTDMRPFLDQGWQVTPKYSHVWDIRDPEATLLQMNRKRRYVRKAQETMLFARESGSAILDDFMRLYRETMKKFNWYPGNSWEGSFRKRIEWLDARDCVRLYTCRTKTGGLACVLLNLLSRPDKTAYAWLIGYDHKLNSKEFPPAIYWYAAKNLSDDFDYLDFGEGNEISIYAFKDSLGTFSLPYYVLKTQNADNWLHNYNQVKKAKQSILSLFGR